MKTKAKPQQRPRPLSEARENYLKAIVRLEAREGTAWVSDIGEFLNVKKPSVTVAIETLRREGLVRHEPYGGIELTASGKKLAMRVVRRHDHIVKFLSQVLQVDRRLAEKDACGMEHVISETTLNKMMQFIEFMGIGKDGKITKCLTRFHEFTKGSRQNAVSHCGDCRGQS